MICSLGERRVEALGDYFVASNAIVVGSVVLGNNANIWFNCVVRADNDVIHIGENCNVQDGSILHVDEGVPLTLHRNASIGHMAMLHGCTVGGKLARRDQCDRAQPCGDRRQLPDWGQRPDSGGEGDPRRFARGRLAGSRGCDA